MKTAETTRKPSLLDRRRLVLGLSGAAVAVASTAASAKPERDEQTAGAYPVTYHRTKTVDGIKIFYREAGPKDAPVVLLLPRFPTPSALVRNLIPGLGEQDHVI